MSAARHDTAEVRIVVVFGHEGRHQAFEDRYGSDIDEEKCEDDIDDGHDCGRARVRYIERRA